MGRSVLCNKIRRDELKDGDHIYYWIGINIYAHHGIYVGNGMVIHYHRQPGEGIGISLDPKIARSSPPTPSIRSCPRCGDQPDHGNGINCSCLDCFLSGKKLRRFRYGVSKAVFFAQARGGTCSLAPADQPEDTVHRANYLFRHGFGSYNLFKNNCEDFAIYCKTSWVIRAKHCSRSGQVAALIAWFKVVWASLPVAIQQALLVAMAIETVPTGILLGMAMVYYVHCGVRYDADVGVRLDKDQVSVEDLASSYLKSKLNHPTSHPETKNKMTLDRVLSRIWFRIYAGTKELKHP